MKVLIVDDSRIMRRMISGAVSVLGYEILEAANGREALEVVRSNPSDLAAITMDINMPEMSGMECLEAIMGDDDISDIPVIMITTESEKEKTLEAIRLGARHYITKPFTPEDVTTRLMDVLGSDDEFS